MSETVLANIIEKQNMRFLLWHSQRLRPLFKSEVGLQNFEAHTAQAPRLIRVMVKIAIFFRSVLGDVASRMPIITTLDNSLLALIRMHQEDSKEVLSQEELDSECAIGKRSVYDVVIAGSGPGGAISSFLNQESGRKTLVVERGNHLGEDVPHHSPQQMMTSFKFGGQEVVISLPPIPFAQANVLGGGSEINSGLYHRLPGSIKASWAAVTGIDSQLWLESEREVEKFLRIEEQPSSSLGVFANSPIASLAEKLQIEHQVVPRWRQYTKSGDFNHFGMQATFLRRFVQGGGEILSKHTVVRFYPEDGDGLIAVLVRGEDCNHVLRCRELILSAGTIGTPEILFNSKVARRKDFRFSFHAMSRVVASFSFKVNDLRDIDPHQAWPKDLDYKIGAAVGNKSMLEATLASLGKPKTKLSPEKLGAYYVSIPSNGRSGLVKIMGDWFPWFIPSKKFREQISFGTNQLAEGLLAAGANEVLRSTQPKTSTVHVFGSLPLGTTPVLSSTGAVRNTRGRVRVRDASILPSHPIMNPQGPLMHLCYALEKNYLRNR